MLLLNYMFVINIVYIVFNVTNLFNKYATMNVDPRDLLEHGSIVSFVLYLQLMHISDAIWAREEWYTNNTLRTRRCDFELWRNGRPVVLPDIMQERLLHA